MTLRLAPFATFLASGTLGEATPGATPGEIARSIGRPYHWASRPGDLFPSAWTYGGLEIRFAPSVEAPFVPKAASFLVDPLRLLLPREAPPDGGLVPLSNSLAMDTQGFTMATETRHFLAAMRAGGPIRTVLVRFGAEDDPVFLVTNGRVELVVEPPIAGPEAAILDEDGIVALLLDAPTPRSVRALPTPRPFEAALAELRVILTAEGMIDADAPCTTLELPQARLGLAPD